MLTPERLDVTGKRVLAAAIYGSETTASGLHIPLIARERYPNVGRVVNIGADVNEDILPGDLAVFETQAFDVPKTYADHFQVVLRDGEELETILVDLDVEPVFHEQMNIYRGSPATQDRWIQLQDIKTDIAYKFMASDVEDFGPVSVDASPFYTLEYINSLMFDLRTDEGDETFYLIHEREILAVIRREDAQGEDI
jgi:co-chaperonin GroES (HSP10)